jgi:hypothetical protein
VKKRLVVKKVLSLKLTGNLKMVDFGVESEGCYESRLRDKN